MRIKKLELKNFKRFTDCTLENIPDEAKLVLLIGSNGSGKSSVFDAFDWLGRGHRGKGMTYDSNYYSKNKTDNPSVRIVLGDGENIYNGVTNTENIGLTKRFLGRSSIRIVPKITNAYNTAQVENDLDSPIAYIENDTRFLNDISLYIQQIDNALREPVFKGKQADTLKIFRDSIEPLNTSLLKILGGDETTTIQIIEYENATPATPAKLIFQKGESKINYELLSHGEKQVVILLINFIVRQEYYNDAIIFIDEMDCHLNTALQHNLINEIVTRWIPENSQLWTASHALGFIEFAKQAENAAIFDFDNFDFDIPKTLNPDPKDRMEIYEIAVPQSMLFQMLHGKKIIVCENQNDRYYNLLGIPETVFVGLADSRDVFLKVKRDPQAHSIRDRDYLSDSELQKLANIYPNLHILKYYDFENYLYHPDNIEELNQKGFNKAEYVFEIKRQKDEKVNYIMPNIGSSRQGYDEFKTPNIKDENANSIVDDLISDDFERFYKFFDMKSQFDRTYLAPLNLSKEKLVQTSWFKTKITEVLNG